MKIKYTKRHLRLQLIFSLFWLIFAVVQILFIDSVVNWVKYIWLTLSIMYLGQFIYQYINQYLSIENGYIKINSPFGKKIILSDVQEIKKFAKKYTLKTHSEELVINLDLINPISLIELNAELRKLNIVWK